MNSLSRRAGVKTMHLLDLTLPTLAENLALDEAMLLEAEDGTGGELLRFWEWPGPAAVLGAGGQFAREVDTEACRRDGVPVQRRASGGGTVLLARGCLLYSLVLAYERDPSLKDVNASYRYILGRIAAALTPIAEATRAGISDLAVEGRKVSGNAQQRKRNHLLHHGTLLYAFDHSRIGRYLRLPEKAPPYRAGRAHEAFVANLDTDVATIKRLLTGEWGARDLGTPLPRRRIAELTADKYDRDDWPARR